MGFFDEYQDTGGDFEGGAFLTAAEKQLLIDDQVAFAVRRINSATTQFGPRWVLGVEIEGEERAIGFSKGKVFSRDRLLTALEQHLQDGGEPVELKIQLSGRSQILVDGASN